MPPVRSIPWPKATGVGVVTLVAAALSACVYSTPYVNRDLKTLEPPRQELRYRLILVGDAGSPKQPEPVLDTAEQWASENPGKTTVVFLGDNVYPRGFVRENRVEAEAILTRQLQVKRSGAAVVFVPGNHDWDMWGRRGLDAIKAQAQFVTGDNTRMMPTAGCPGPDHLDLPQGAASMRLVVLDTQWWLHHYDRGADCAPSNEKAVSDALRALMATDLPVVIAAHHPLATHGPHGGYEPISEGLLAPVFGILRRVWGHDQDLFGRRNRAMVKALEGAIHDSPRQALTIYAAGHEHGLQVLKGRAADYVMVSGAGASDHTNPVGRGSDMLYGHAGSGFMVLDVREGGMSLAVVEVSGPSVTSRWFRLAR